ncbi:DEAD-domain-containing protein [Amylostereum chailletii]|nr:DEAD-domain-containing protein [Amylostereum chailletii]
MPVRKRPHPSHTDDSEEELSDAPSSSDEDHSDSDAVDISSALAGHKKRKLTSNTENGRISHNAENDEDDIADLIRDSIAKRNTKEGTGVVKNAKGKNKLVKGEVGGGSFQSMGLFPWLLRSLTLQGFRTPTPIQRQAIPMLLSSPPRDLVGMARTGSGKSLAFLVPLVQRLGGRHSSSFGARALILLPARELALQILKVGKELARGWKDGEGGHAGDKEADDGESAKRGQALRWGLVVGGESLDEQFEMISSNPDVIIATPGRLLHLMVEMNLDLRSIQYVVFDEADRLFEMGFETALTEIVHRLPSTRQTLLFSATLPKAGLQNPKLVRLDAEGKISTDLRMAFFSVKQDEKDACLLLLLRDVIGVPLGANKPTGEDGEAGLSEKKRGKRRAREVFMAPHQTLVFAATKHHVEYLTNLLTTAGYAVSHIYGALDQTARSQQMEQFRRGQTNILVVTDVAARGIDIPVLENVVNYDFPQGARVFVHRVGRTARAGRQGWAWSFISNVELPYLLDLQLFLGRPIQSDVPASRRRDESTYTESLILGSFAREIADEEVEYIRSLDTANNSLPTLRGGQAADVLVERRDEDEKRKVLLQAVNSFKPTETALEIGTKGKTGNADLMKQRRKALIKAVERAAASSSSVLAAEESEEEVDGGGLANDVEMADEADIQAVFDVSKPRERYRDSDFYMSHYQKGADTEKGYSLRDGASFIEQARNATFDLAGDEGRADQKRANLSWDKKKKKFIKGDGAGADNMKMVKTESGIKLPATYRSGRFDEWKAKSHVSLPKVGEAEGEMSARFAAGVGKRHFKHHAVKEAKPLDKYATDYERKSRQIKKRTEASGGDVPAGPGKAKGGKKPQGRYGAKPMGRVKNELKSADQIRRDRKLMENRRAKNARPSRGKGRR